MKWLEIGVNQLDEQDSQFLPRKQQIHSKLTCQVFTVQGDQYRPQHVSQQKKGKGFFFFRIPLTATLLFGLLLESEVTRAGLSHLPFTITGILPSSRPPAMAIANKIVLKREREGGGLCADFFLLLLSFGNSSQDAADTPGGSPPISQTLP